ncbi:MAG TPA: prolipoprotein diacylglyceryl transferase [Thermoanaerobaculia bacterium]|nr:prolipoprotein diacylglyceryl transferase [Thermoanaerobaculia bacterium]
MWPTLFKVGDIEITTFGAMMALAFVVGGWILTRRFRRYGLGDDDASSIVIAAAVGGILGAKIYYAILYGDLTLVFSRAGLVWYGGFLGGVIASAIVARLHKLRFLVVADAASPGLAVGYALGRIGCFLVGDDYGRPTDGWFGVAFPKGAPPTTAESLRSFGVAIDPTLPGDALLRVHPTQLYEAAAALLIFGALIVFARRPLAAGRVFGLFLVLAGIERFLVEILRAKDDRFFGPLTLAQAISVAVVAIGIVLLVRRESEIIDTRE